MEDKKSLVIEFFSNPDEIKFIKLWEFNPDMAMKCLFYILDQKTENNVFIDIFCGWIYQNYRKTFFKNLSLILGIYNEKILTDEQLKEIAKVDYEQNEKQLEELVYKNGSDLRDDYREAFRREFFSRVRKTYFTEVYILPIYGSVKVMRLVQERMKDEKLVYHTIEHLFQKYKSKRVANKAKFEEQYKFVSR